MTKFTGLNGVLGDERGELCRKRSPTGRLQARVAETNSEISFTVEFGQLRAPPAQRSRGDWRHWSGDWVAGGPWGVAFGCLRCAVVRLLGSLTLGDREDFKHFLQKILEGSLSLLRLCSGV